MDSFLPWWATLIILFALTVINGFFSATEIAVLQANKHKIRKLAEGGNKKARRVEKLANDSANFLSAVQVGVTFAGYFASALGASHFATPVGSWLNGWMHITWGYTLAFIVITIFLSYFSLVLGELFPKRVALRFPDKFAMFASGVFGFFKALVLPLVKILSWSTEFLVKITRLEAHREVPTSVEEDIIGMMDSGVEEGRIASAEQEMIESIFKLDNLDAKDVMTPRVDVEMIDINAPLEEYFASADFGKYTRIPVYKETKDNVIGILHIKDLLIIAYRDKAQEVNIGKIMRKALFVPDNMKINEVYKRLMKKKTHIALVTDEFGGFSGIVTVEDIIEEIIGNINDEFDDKASDIVQIDSHHYEVWGQAPIQDVNRALDLELDEDNEAYDTIGGLLITAIGRIPKPGEAVEAKIGSVTLRALEIDVNHIEKVLITLSDEAPAEED